MMAKYSIRLLLTIVAANFLVATMAFSQVRFDDGKERRNALGLTVSLNEFFDSNQLWQSRRQGTLRWVNLTYGLEYDRKMSDLHGFALALKLTDIHYFSPNLQYGQTFERTYVSVDAYYRRRIIKANRTNVYGLLGINSGMALKLSFTIDISMSQSSIRTTCEIWEF
jgi:hypothetical protein